MTKSINVPQIASVKRLSVLNHVEAVRDLALLIDEKFKKAGVPTPSWDGNKFAIKGGHDKKLSLKGLINANGRAFLLKCGGTTGKAVRNRLATVGIRLINAVA